MSEPLLDQKPEVVPIAPGSKWAVVLPAGTDKDKAQLVAAQLKAWWQDDHSPFMVLSADLHLVRLDEDGNPVLSQDPLLRYLREDA